MVLSKANKWVDHVFTMKENWLCEAVSVIVPDSMKPVPQERKTIRKAENLLNQCFVARYGKYGDSVHHLSGI